MATTVTVNCPVGVYTQVTTATAAYCIVSSPVDSRENGQKIRVHIGAVAPAPTTKAFHLLPKDRHYERPTELDGHIWILPESQDADIPVSEAV
jgi:hypothetical protein